MRTATDLKVGDRLISVTTPGQAGRRWSVTDKKCSITIGELPGPMGMYLVAVIAFWVEGPDLIIPLHMAESFEVSI